MGLPSREDEAARIPAHLGREPVGVRVGADHEEETDGWHRLLLAACQVAQHEMVEPSVVATAADHLGGGPHVHVRSGLHLAREIVDMPTASDCARTTSVTRRAKRARWSAACPAELAPPRT